MKRYFLILLVFAASYIISSCRPGSAPSPSDAGSVEDQASLVTALQASGATIEISDTITQGFFTPEGHIIKVNGQDVQVFEYKDTQGMEKEAAQVAPDGGSVGTSMMMWMDAPHFYKTGRIIVLYVGNDQTVTDLLNKVIGPQFAGR